MQSRIIKKSRVQVEERAGARLDRRRPSAPECAKSARLLEENGLVRAVEVTCSCGEKTVIELEYGPDTDSES